MKAAALEHMPTLGSIDTYRDHVHTITRPLWCDGILPKAKMQTTHKHLFIIIKKINYKLHLQAASSHFKHLTDASKELSYNQSLLLLMPFISSKKKIFSLQEINLWKPDKKDVANGLLGHLAERRQNLILFSTYKKICSFVWYKMIRENFSSKWKQSHLWRKITSQWHLRLLQAYKSQSLY